MTDKPVLTTYHLRHRRSGYWCQISATSAQEACRKAGWLIGDVWVGIIGPADHPTTWEDVPLKDLEHISKEERSNG